MKIVSRNFQNSKIFTSILANFKFTNFRFLTKFPKSNFSVEYKHYFDDSVRKNLDKKFGVPDFGKVINNDKNERIKYEQYINDRMQRKINFNRKTRWEQKELNEIIINFDLKTAKNRDLNSSLKEKITEEFSSSSIFNQIEKIYSKKEFLVEDEINKILDVFNDNIGNYSKTIYENQLFLKFSNDVILGLTSYSKETTLVKSAKFFDFYVIPNRNAWFNLEKVILQKLHTNFSAKSYISILENFANAKEGTGEFYDMFQFLFWSGTFKNSSIKDLVCLGYSMFLTDQGYDLFYNNLSSELILKLHESDTYDLIKIIQIYSIMAGNNYSDLFYKLEEIILKRKNSFSAKEAAMIACGYSISSFGTLELYNSLEKLILADFNLLDVDGLRDFIRAFIVSQVGSNKAYLLALSELLNYPEKLNKFTINEVVYIMKYFHERFVKNSLYKELGIEYSTLDKFFKILENNLIEKVTKLGSKDVLLEEICTICHYYCEVKLISRETQKLMESTILDRINDIRKNQQVLKFLYKIFVESKMCSTSLLDLLMSNKI